MEVNDLVSNGHSMFVVSKIKGNKFKARLNGAYFDGNIYDYHFSEGLKAWVINAEALQTGGKILKRKA